MEKNEDQKKKFDHSNLPRASQNIERGRLAPLPNLNQCALQTNPFKYLPSGKFNATG